MSAVKTKDILESKITPLMFKLGWPVMAAALLETFYQLADTFWLGRLGGNESANAVAALQVAFPILWFFAAAAAGFSMSGTALVSQHTGAGNSDKADIATTQIISFAAITGIIITIFGILLAPMLLPFISGETAITKTAVSYLVWFFPATSFIFISASFRVLSAAAGDTKTPLMITLFSNVINIILDPILIAGAGPIPALGVVGAAAATLISTILAAIAVLVILIRGNKKLSIDLKHIVPEKFWMKQIFKIGAPAALGHSAESFGFIILMSLISRLPNATAALAGYGIVSRLTSFVFIPAQGLGQGLSTIIGHSLGADNFKRAKKTSLVGIKIITLTILTQMVIMIPLRKELIALFIPDNQEVIMEGARFMLIFGMSFPFFGVVRGITSAFNAAGTNVPSMLIGFARLWLFRIPFTWIGGFVLGYAATGVWVGMGLSNFLSMLIAIFFFSRGKWLRNLTSES